MSNLAARPAGFTVVRVTVVLLLLAAAYGVVRYQRGELIDLAVPRTAAARFLAHEPLYRLADGHYQYKYFPLFALIMTPFALVPRVVAEMMWFALMVAMIWAFVRLSLEALPERRLRAKLLVWITLLVTGKFIVRELALGQFNLLVALFLIGAVIAAQNHRAFAAGTAVAAGAFVKPYAFVMVPWLVGTLGWRAFVSFCLVLVAGLALPTAFYGWEGNLTLLRDWYRTVTETTGPNLLAPENISFASMWAKWLEPGAEASGLALASAVVAVAAGGAIMLWRRSVAEPNYLEGAYFFLLIPLLSPQGWDYVLLIALPAYMCLVDRWRDMSRSWRVVVVIGISLTSFTIFDLLGRSLYVRFVQLAAVSVGAVLIAACLVRLRWRAVA
ncbi:MAG TPA: glycosyltransferase family 87 protein [Terriglobia bacterium]|nr:glycosyltransferase family 87 protein [Terriglobia bacterium]